MEPALLGLCCVLATLWAVTSHFAGKRTADLAIRLADAVSQDTLKSILDRTMAKSPAEQAARTKATQREASNGLTPVDRMYSEEQEPEEFVRVQPRSHAHIPELAQYQTIVLGPSEAKCYPPSDGHGQIQRIPLESYWRLVEQHAGHQA